MRHVPLKQLHFQTTQIKIAVKFIHKLTFTAQCELRFTSVHFNPPTETLLDSSRSAELPRGRGGFISVSVLLLIQSIASGTLITIY